MMDNLIKALEQDGSPLALLAKAEIVRLRGELMALKESLVLK
jgi:hypothetical protein